MTAHASISGDTRIVVLRPGEFHFGDQNTRISTLLGSCVSITLWHPRRRIGGMCHYMLTERQRPPTTPPDGRYAAEAFELLLQHVSQAGTHPQEYQAKLFGGACMFSDSANGQMDIGVRNIDYGLAFLADNGIALVSRHIGGNGRRKLHFDLWSGDVWLAFPEGEGATTSKPPAIERSHKP
jgi:chemotaxis protein CheD